LSSLKPRWKRDVLAVVCAAAFLLTAPEARSGDVHVYTDREIRPALLEFLHGGVVVRVILDPDQSGNQAQVDCLKQHGVEVKRFPVNKPAQAHRKLAVADGVKRFAREPRQVSQFPSDFAHPC